MKTLYGRAFLRGAIESDVLVSIDGAAISDVRQSAAAPPDAERIEGLMVPGFIDVHVHGGDGADFMDGDDEANTNILALHARHGTTALAATTLSASREDLQNAVKAIRRSAHSASEGAQIVGIHLEGPYISAARAGAQDRASIRPADIHEIAALIAQAPRLSWMITVAPEVDGVSTLIEHFRDRVRFSIGHTSATYAEAVTALDLGATHFTHLFNAMTPLTHREPGVVGAAMVGDDSTVELIADGIHLHRAALHIVARMMPQRIALVTDAMRACGMPDGNYKLYDLEVTVEDGAARLADGTLAGSVLTMDAAVRNMVELAGLPIEAVLPFATSTPARILGVSDRKGALAIGFDADLVVLNSRLECERVFARGREIAAHGTH